MSMREIYPDFCADQAALDIVNEAMDKNGDWWLYSEEPFIRGEQWHTEGESSTGMIDNDVFDIAPADDWTKSLIKIEG